MLLFPINLYSVFCVHLYPKAHKIVCISGTVKDVLKKFHEVQTVAVPMPSRNLNPSGNSVFEESSLDLKRKELELQEKVC